MSHTGMQPGAAILSRIPDESVCSTLLAQIPPQVAAHSRAVQRLALEMCDALAAHGVRLNRSLLSAAALLHDICRTEPNHAFAGAQKLRDLGYPEIADIVPCITIGAAGRLMKARCCIWRISTCRAISA